MFRRTTYLCILLALAACGDNLGPVVPPDAAQPGSPDAAPDSPDAAVGSPTVSDQQLSTAEDTAVEITIEASDPDDDPLQFTLGLPTSGTVTGTPPAVTYTPDADFNGTDTFTVEVSDGALTATATITVTVTPVNDAPVALNELYGFLPIMPLEITLEATDVDGDTLTYTIVDQPENGTLSGDGAEQTYTPDDGFIGQDSFTFRANDGTLDSNLAVVRIVVITEDCGDGEVVAPEECDDDNNEDGDGCSAFCLIERCGDGTVNNDDTEICDDGNTVAGDGCRADCRGREECGDGLVDSGAGEECDDDNTADDDGCSSECVLENPFVSVPAQPISGALSCTTANSNTGRKAGVDQLGRFYVVMNCGGEAYVATSVDRGTTWSAPVSTGITGITAPREVAIEGGASGIAYVAAGIGSGDLVFTRTTDGGATWQAVSTLATGIDPSEVSLDSFEESVFISVPIAGGLRILRNANGGQGSFESTDLAQANVFHDVILDKVSGNVVSVSDTPAFHVRISSDQGVTFGAESQPPGEAFVSDWIGSNGFLYVVGLGGTDVDVIPVASPGTSTQVNGLPDTFGGRAIDADALGNAYVITQLDNGNVQLDRMRLGATAIDPADVRPIGAGTVPAVVGLPSNNGALIAYTSGTTVYGAVVVY